MYDGLGELQGIHLLLCDGSHGAVKGSYNGLVRPNPLPPKIERLLVTFDVLDAAKALGIGFYAVCQPRTATRASDLSVLAEHHGVEEVVILAEPTASSERGANSLANEIVSLGLVVRVLVLPDGLRAACTGKDRDSAHETLKRAIEMAPQWSRSIRHGGEGIPS